MVITCNYKPAMPAAGLKPRRRVMFVLAVLMSLAGLFSATSAGQTSSTVQAAQPGTLVGSAALSPSAPSASSTATAENDRVGQYLDQAAELRQQAEVDWPAVLAAYEAAASLGSYVAMSHVGWIHENGLGTPVDLQEAARWYRQVAESGRTEYAIKLGWLYLNPALGPDRQQAEAWFERAVNHDSADARVALASVWVADAQGGDTTNLEQAHTLLEQALQQDHPLASYFLARIHVESIGGYPSSAEQQLQYTQLAAEAGHAPMQVWLAQRYLEGDAVADDRVAAATWAALAAAQGEPEGLAMHEALQAQLSSNERQEVLQRTVAWALAHQQAPQVRAASPGSR